MIIGLGSKLQIMQSKEVRNITSYPEIDLELPGKKKCAYFCIVSDQDRTFDFLSSLFFSFLFIKLIRYADGYCEGGVLNPKVKFILDEFPNCCLIPDFTKKCSTIRSRGCSVAVFFQNVGQMKNRYPDDQWQEILGACDSTVFLGCTDILTAEYISDRVGVASVEVEGTTRELNSIRISNYTPRFRRTNSLGRRQLLTPDEVLRMPPDQELIFIRGEKVMRAKRYDYSLQNNNDVENFAYIVRSYKATVGGKTYGVSTGNSEPRACLYFNKQILEAAGIDWNTIYDKDNAQKKGRS